MPQTTEEWINSLATGEEEEIPVSTEDWIDALPSGVEEEPWWQRGWEAGVDFFGPAMRVYYGRGGEKITEEPASLPIEQRYTGRYYLVKVERPSGTKVLDALKFEWETEWPDIIAMGAIIGGVAAIQVAKNIPTIAFKIHTLRFAKGNVEALKKRFPEVVKDVESARDLTEAAAITHVDKLTKNMSRAQQTSVYKAFGKWLSSQTLGVPEAITGPVAKARPTEVIPKLLEVPAAKATGTKLAQLLQAQIPRILEQAKVSVGPKIVGPISDFIAKSVGKLPADTAVSLINKDLPMMIEQARAGMEPTALKPEKPPITVTEKVTREDVGVEPVAEAPVGEEIVSDATLSTIGNQFAKQLGIKGEMTWRLAESSVREFGRTDTYGEWRELEPNKYEMTLYLGTADRVRSQTAIKDTIAHELTHIQRTQQGKPKQLSYHDSDFYRDWDRNREALGLEITPIEELVPEAKAPIAEVPEELTLAIKDITTGKIHTATPDEKIHPDMMPRLKLKPDEMELGWVDPKDKFYNVFDVRRRLAGPELIKEPVLARPLVAEPTVEPTLPEVMPPPIPEIKRTEIIKRLSDDLGVPIRLGHFRQRALGIYKTKPQIIRLKAPIDVPTTAHEIGHYLDKEVFKFKLPEYKEELIALDPKKKSTEEGMAEFVSLYVTDPDRAQKLAPDFYDEFDAQVTSVPEIKGMLRLAGDDYQRWLKMPSAAKVASQIAAEPQRATVGFREGVGRLYSLMVDELYPLKRYTDIARKKGFEVKAEDDPFILATLHRGWHGKADAYLQHKTFDANFQWSGEPLNAILQEVTNKDALRDFDSYLVAKQSVFRLEHGKKIGIDQKTATEAIKELEEAHPEFRDLSKRIYDYQDRLLRYVRDSGLISEASYDKFRVNLSYVPLHRVIEELGSRGYLGKGFADLPSVFKKLKGSEREIIPPTESIVKHTYIMIDAAERNQVARAMTRLAQVHPELGRKVEKIPSDMARVAQLSEQEITAIVRKQGFDLGPEEITELANVFRPSMFAPKGNILKVVEDGKPTYYQVDPEIYKALEMLDRESSNLLIQMLSYPARMLRLGAVSLSPEFLVRNPVRDSFTAWVYSKGGFIPGLDSMRGVWSALGHDEMYWKWKISGGEHSMLTSLDRQYMQDDVKALTASRLAKAKNVIRHPLQSAQMLAELGEEATRIGEYRLVQQGGKRWWLGAERIPETETERERMLRAGYAAREVTLDFARLGAKTRSVNQIIAFWNANVQDIDKTRRSFQGNPIRTLVKLIAGITIPSVLLYLATKDDPRIQELPQWQRDLFWIIPTENTLWRIPKPFNLGMIFGSGAEHMLRYMEDNDPESIKKLADNILQGAMPGILPTAFLAPIEVATNYSFFLDRPVISESLERLPPELQYNRYTPEVAKQIGNLLGVSPESVEHMVRGYTGGFGRLAMETGDAMTQAVLGRDTVKPARTLADVPVIRGFVAREPWGSSESVNRLYEMLERAEQGAAAIKQMKRERNREKIMEYQERYPEWRFVKGLRSTVAELADLRRKRNMILDSNLSPEEKLERVTAIEKMMTKRAQFRVGAIRKLL